MKRNGSARTGRLRIVPLLSIMLTLCLFVTIAEAAYTKNTLPTTALEKIQIGFFEFSQSTLTGIKINDTKNFVEINEKTLRGVALKQTPAEACGPYTGDPLFTLAFSDIGTINGRSVSADVDIVKLWKDKEFSTSSAYSYANKKKAGELRSQIIKVTPGYLWFGGNVAEGDNKWLCLAAEFHVQPHVTVYWSDDASKKPVDLPIIAQFEDIDANSNTATDKTLEAIETVSGFNPVYYTYSGNSLQFTETKNGNVKVQSAQLQKPLDGNDSILKGGFYASTTNGQFELIFHEGLCGSMLKIGPALPSKKPQKTHEIFASDSTTKKDSLDTVDDIIRYKVEQKIGTKAVDAWATYSALKIEDPIPTGLQYVTDSAKIYLVSSTGAETDITKDTTIGSLSFDSTENKVVYTADPTWLGKMDNYQGQTFRLVFDCSIVDKKDEYDNQASTYVNKEKFETEVVKDNPVYVTPTYQYVSGTPGMDLPEAISSTTGTYKITDTNKYLLKETATRDNSVPVNTTYEVKDGDKLLGTWTLSNWDADTKTVTSDKTGFVGTWVYTPAPLKITYDVKEDPEWGMPTDSKEPVDPTAYQKNDPVTVKDDLTTKQDYAVDPKTGEKVPGAWTFTPWDKDDFNITEDTTITGSWKFTPGALKVTYEVGEDPEWGTPTDSKKPNDSTSYMINDPVKVEDDLTTKQDYAIDPKTGDKIPGTWTFTPWDKDDFNITENTTITGSWKFTPAPLKVTYEVKQDPEWGTPTDSKTPEDPTIYKKNDSVTVKDDLTTKQDYAIDPKTGEKVPGAWIFTPWDKDDFNITEDTTITGSWKFTPGALKVTYEVEEDPEWGTPTDSKKPNDPTPYNPNDLVKVKDDLVTKQEYAVDPKTGEKIPGTWKFTPWDKDDFNITKDTTITGSWKFTPNVYKVTYEVEEDPKWGTPADSKVPSDPKAYEKNGLVTVKDDLTSTCQYAIVNGKKVPGKWTFSGWDHDDFHINANTTIKGTWKFTPDLPKTGDHSGIFFWFIVLAMCAFGFAFMTNKSRRNTVK